MRLLIASDFVRDENAGSAGTLLDLGRALAARGHVIDYLWRDDRPYKLPHPSLSRWMELPRRQFRQIADELSRTPYDVVLISQPYAYLVYERLRAAYPRTVFLNMTHGWEDCLNAARLRFAWDGPYSPVRRLGLNLSKAIVDLACRRTVRACDGLIVPTRAGSTYIRRRYGVGEDKVAVIPLGLDGAFLNPDLGRREHASALRLLYVGSYIALKGSDVLETVLPPLAKAYPDASMTFVVPSEVAPRVASQFGPAFGSRLAVLPWRDRHAMPGVYAQHDVLIFPSLFEGFGKTFLEAMACGVCVVGFGEGGLPDVAQSGQDAFYCQTGDVSSMQALIEHCLRNPGLAREVGQRARATARRYSLDISAGQAESFCDERRQALATSHA